MGRDLKGNGRFLYHFVWLYVGLEVILNVSQGSVAPSAQIHTDKEPNVLHPTSSTGCIGSMAKLLC